MRWTMKFVRAKHLLLSVTAIMSLFVSAVSACACSHDEPVKVEAESCHSSSHEAPSAEHPNGSPVIGSDCNCFVRTPVPAIVAKKDDKRSTIDKHVPFLTEVPFVVAIGFGSGWEASVSFESSVSNYQQALLSSLPSRAPPRL